MPVKSPQIQKSAQAAPSLAGQALWLTSGRVVAYGFSVVLPIVLVRLLDQAAFGLYKQAFLVVATAQGSLPFGFGVGLYYFFPREQKRQSALVLHTMAFYLAGGFAILLVLTWFPESLAFVFDGPELVRFAPLIGWMILLLMLSALLEAVATAHQEVRHATVFIVLGQLLRTVLLLAAALWIQTLDALLWAALLQALVQSVLLAWYLQSRFHAYWRAWDGELFRKQLRYALPMGFAGLTLKAQTELHLYFVANHFGPAEFAIYAVGCMQLPLIALFRNSVATVLLRPVSDLQQKGQHREILCLMASAVRKLAVLFLPLYVFLLVTGREFVLLLFTPAYESSWPIFLVYLTLLPLTLVMNDPIIRAYTELHPFVLRVRVVLLLLSVIALPWAMARWGMLGAVMVVVAVRLADHGLVARRALAAMGARLADLEQLRDVAKLAAAAASAGLAAAWLRAVLVEQSAVVVLLACGVLFTAVYAAGVYFSGALASNEAHELRKHWLRLRHAVLAR